MKKQVFSNLRREQPTIACTNVQDVSVHLGLWRFLVARMSLGPKTHRLIQQFIQTHPHDPKAKVLQESLATSPLGNVSIDDNIGVIHALADLMDSKALERLLNGSEDAVKSYRPSRPYQALYHRTPQLKNLSNDDITTPARLFEALESFRHAIHRRPSFSNGTNHASPTSNGHYHSFQDLTRALLAGGRVPLERKDEFLRAAAYRDLFEYSEVLKNFSQEHCQDPATLVQHLPELRARIEQEALVLYPLREEKPEYGYASITAALAAAGRIPEAQAETFQWWANALDRYETSPRLRSFSPQLLQDPLRLIAELRAHRERVVQQTSPSWEGSASLSSLLLAVVTGNSRSLPRNEDQRSNTLQKLFRTCTAVELYEGSPILQSIDASTLDNNQLYRTLKRLAPAITDEQRKLRLSFQDRVPKNYAVTTLVFALQMGQQLRALQTSPAAPPQATPQVKDRTREISARTILDRSPTLRSIPPEVIAIDQALTRFLLSRRDRIAVENAIARGTLSENQYLFDHAEDYYSLSTLAQALRAGGLLEDKRATQYVQAVCGPLEYFLKRQSEIGPYIQSLADAGRPLNTLKGVDLTRFTSLQDRSKLICDRYVRRILLLGHWIQSDSTVQLRSLFHATELIDEVLGSAPPGVLSPERAATFAQERARAGSDPCKSRTRVVRLMQTLWSEGMQYGEAQDAAPEHVTHYLDRLQTLIAWNQDALESWEEDLLPTGFPIPFWSQAPLHPKGKAPEVRAQHPWTTGNPLPRPATPTPPKVRYQPQQFTLTLEPEVMSRVLQLLGRMHQHRYPTTSLASAVTPTDNGSAVFQLDVSSIRTLQTLIQLEPEFSDLQAVVHQAQAALPARFWKPAAQELFASSALLQGIAPAHLATPKAAVTHLLAIREAVLQEQVPAVHAHAVSFSIRALMNALISGGAISTNKHIYEQWASARDLYDRYECIRTTDIGSVSEPERTLEHIQHQIQATTGEHVSLRDITAALIAGGRVGSSESLALGRLDPKQLLLKSTPSTPIEHSATLRGIPQEILADDEALIRFLFARRDRIAIECLPHQEHSEHTPLSLHVLFVALASSGLLDKRRVADLSSHRAAYLEFFLKQRATLEPEVMRLNASPSRLDLNILLFTRLDKPQQHVSPHYARQVVRLATGILKDPSFAVRSIFTAEELIDMAFQIHDTTALLTASDIDHLEHLRGSAATHPRETRRNTVEFFGTVASREASALTDTTPRGQGVRTFQQLAAWNQDALSGTAPAITAQAPPIPLATMPILPLPLIRGGLSFIR